MPNGVDIGRVLTEIADRLAILRAAVGQDVHVGCFKRERFSWEANDGPLMDVRTTGIDVALFRAAFPNAEITYGSWRKAPMGDVELRDVTVRLGRRGEIALHCDEVRMAGSAPDGGVQ